MALDEITSQAELELAIENGNGVEALLKHRFPNIDKQNWRGSLARAASAPVKYSLHWMANRPKPENARGLRKTIKTVDYGVKWTLSYGLASWVLGDQRPETQRLFAKALKLKHDYDLSSGNVVTGAIEETAMVYNVAGPLIEKVAHAANMPEFANFVDQKGTDLWMIGYSVLYIGGRTSYIIRNKQPVPGLGFKTLGVWLASESMKGKLDTFTDTGKWFYKHFEPDISQVRAGIDYYKEKLKKGFKNSLKLGVMDSNLGINDGYTDSNEFKNKLISSRISKTQYGR